MKGRKTGASFSFVLRVTLGGVLIYAGVVKFLDPKEFAESLASFRMLPLVMINPVSAILPMFEMILGSLLLLGVQVRAVALGAVSLSGIFVVFHGQALLRGIKVSCGCLGAASSSWIGESSALWIATAMLVGSVLLWFLRIPSSVNIFIEGDWGNCLTKKTKSSSQHCG